MASAITPRFEIRKALAVLALCAIGNGQAALGAVFPGPDEFGYSGAVVPSALRNVSATGVFVSLGDDQVSVPLPIGFTFNFYGIDYTEFRISSNGFITLGNSDQSSGCCTGAPIPSAFSPDNVIAGFWEDLNNPQGNIRFETLGAPGSRELVVGFYAVPHFRAGPAVTFEIVLREGSDEIEIQCSGCVSDGGAHTIGIENNTGAIGLQIANTTSSVPPTGWLLFRNAAPDCSEAVASHDELWPPNHKFRDLEILGVTDQEGDPVEIFITEITQDEPVDGAGDGSTEPDADGLGTSIASLRSERSGQGDGRIYHVRFAAQDDQGGECMGEVTVCVPHDRGTGEDCGDQGRRFDSITGEPVPLVIGPTNGGFETGDFTGWGQINSGSGGIVVDDGTFVPPGPGGSVAPFEGSFAAATFQGGPGIHTLFADVTLPANLLSATLFWADHLQNWAGVFSDPNQEWRVEVWDPADNSLLGELFSTDPGDPPLQPWTERSGDLASWIGQTIRLAFTQQDNLGFFNARLDDVRVLAQQPLAVSVDVAPVSQTNHVDPFSTQPTSVAVLGTAQLDVAIVDLASLSFGAAGAAPTSVRFEDVNGDGRSDLLANYATNEAGIAIGDKRVCLHGALVDGDVFEGCDGVETMRPGCGLGFELAFLLPLLMWLHQRKRPTNPRVAAAGRWR